MKEAYGFHQEQQIAWWLNSFSSARKQLHKAIRESLAMHAEADAMNKAFDKRKVRLQQRAAAMERLQQQRAEETLYSLMGRRTLRPFKLASRDTNTRRALLKLAVQQLQETAA